MSKPRGKAASIIGLKAEDLFLIGSISLCTGNCVVEFVDLDNTPREARGGDVSFLFGLLESRRGWLPFFRPLCPLKERLVRSGCAQQTGPKHRDDEENCGGMTTP